MLNKDNNTYYVYNSPSLTHTPLLAGLGLKLDVLKKNKLLVTCLSVLPCVIEVIAVACVAVLALKLPWNWAFLLG